MLKIRHEIAHAIQLEHRLNDPLWDEKYAKICKNYDELNESIDKQGIAYTVSRCAMVNTDEFISECIAKSMMKKPGVLVNTVVKIIKGDD